MPRARSCFVIFLFCAALLAWGIGEESNAQLEPPASTPANRAPTRWEQFRDRLSWSVQGKMFYPLDINNSPDHVALFHATAFGSGMVSYRAFDFLEVSFFAFLEDMSYSEFFKNGLNFSFRALATLTNRSVSCRFAAGYLGPTTLGGGLYYRDYAFQGSSLSLDFKQGWNFTVFGAGYDQIDFSDVGYAAFSRSNQRSTFGLAYYLVNLPNPYLPFISGGLILDHTLSAFAQWRPAPWFRLGGEYTLLYAENHWEPWGDTNTVSASWFGISSALASAKITHSYVVQADLMLTNRRREHLTFSVAHRSYPWYVNYHHFLYANYQGLLALTDERRLDNWDTAFFHVNSVRSLDLFLDGRLRFFHDRFFLEARYEALWQWYADHDAFMNLYRAGFAYDHDGRFLARVFIKNYGYPQDLAWRKNSVFEGGMTEKQTSERFPVQITPAVIQFEASIKL